LQTEADNIIVNNNYEVKNFHSPRCTNTTVKSSKL